MSVLAGASVHRKQTTDLRWRELGNLVLFTVVTAFSLIGVSAAVLGPVAHVTRGPYLQTGTPESVVVRWRTDVPTTSLVRYGTAPNALPFTALASGVSKEHIVLVAGLKANTRYFYAIGTTNALLAGADTSHTFVTAPPSGATQASRVWVLGDSGTKNANARAVRDAYARFNGQRHTDLVLMLGDNAYPNGTDDEYQAAVFKMYPDILRQTVLWPTLGNHDGRSANSSTQSGVYYDIFTLPTQGQAGGVASGTEAYYSFDYGNVHYVCLDSHDTDRKPGSPMLTWLRHDLAQNQQTWTIAFFHHPPYTKGGHDSDSATDSGGRMVEMREHVLPLLEAGGVDLVLTGHSHSYERSYLLQGHYGGSTNLVATMKKNAGDGRVNGNGAYAKPGPGPVPNAGSVYIVAGSSGQVSGGKLNHPAMFISLNSLGSLVLDVNGPRLDGTFIDERAAVRDTFTIVKEPAKQ